MFRLIDDDPVKFRAAVPEKHLGTIAVGQQVRVTVEAYPKQTFSGRVARINPQVDPSSRNFMIEIVVPNDKQMLRPGGFARGRVETALDPNVVSVPQSAVVSFAGVHRVFTVKDGKAVEHPVELGDRVSEDQIEVRGDLVGGEQVVVDGAAKVARETPVVVIEAPATQPSTQPVPAADSGSAR